MQIYKNKSSNERIWHNMFIVLKQLVLISLIALLLKQQKLPKFLSAVSTKTINFEKQTNNYEIFVLGLKTSDV